MVHTTPAGARFTVDSDDPMLARRSSRGTDTADGASPGTTTLAVVPAERGKDVFVPMLPRLPVVRNNLGGHWLGTGHRWHDLNVDDGTTAAMPMELTRDALAALVRVAGQIVGERLDWNQQAAVQHLLAHALRAVAPQGANPAEMVQVARALNSDRELFLLFGRPGPASASFHAKSFRKHLNDLRPGQHGYVRVTLAVHGCAAHALAIGVRKERGGRVRLAAINPAGWPQDLPGDAAPAGRDRVVPAVFRTVEVKVAADALASLLEQPLPPGPASDDARDWVSSGQPLHDWLAGLGGASVGSLQADFHGTGRPLLTAPQKADDCTIEQVFAFMATALRPADYKLAKAAGLNLLLQLANRLEPPDTAAPGSDLEAARYGLEWRMTSSLSGSVAARERPPAG